jgi:hypothetical protein
MGLRISTAMALLQILRSKFFPSHVPKQFEPVVSSLNEVLDCLYDSDKAIQSKERTEQRSRKYQVDYCLYMYRIGTQHIANGTGTVLEGLESFHERYNLFPLLFASLWMLIN